jgi:acetyl esterase/lipase
MNESPLKYSVIILLTTLFIIIVTSPKSFAQQNNFNEDYSEYLSEMKNLNEILSKLPPSPSILTAEGLERSRKNLAAFNNTNTVLKSSRKEINGPSGNLPLTITKPDTINAIVLQIHGGGWYQGSPELGAHLNDEMARACKVAVVSVDYRLVPENPFPACVEDCKSVARWLIDNAKNEFGTDRIFISGESAGAHLAALTTIYIRDSLNAIDKVRGVNLIYGIYDLGRTPSHRMATDSSFLSKRNLADMMKLVFGDWSVQQLQQPQYSPLYANLSSLPPALFTVGAIDPFVDDTYFMESRWRMAGNKTYLAVYPESGHGVDGLPIKMAKVARAKMYWWINSLNEDLVK